VLRDIQGLSYQEIVNVTGLNLGTVKSRLARARMELRKNLAPSGRAFGQDQQDIQDIYMG